MTTLADFTATALDGTERDLSEHLGSVVLVVNTATACGLTPQFKGLQELHDEFAAQGLVVLGFPCAQFANQERRDEEQIGEFCSANYGVEFPMFARVDVNGPDAHPLFRWLRTSKKGLGSSAIKWNFTKFLVGRDGRVLKRYAPTTAPSAIAEDIRAALA
ncbi:glutathione peroxidase [Demequina pelophila]|uniref:glutathione peroxidase n=1 Tax=Demequina pelophila TaxID=1638984 RepID=UPI0007847E60|nr:glutathione peroxidase [Demequina pelophila]